MDLNIYQTQAVKTAVYPKPLATCYPIIGLVGEAGELANKFKKVLRGDRPFDAKLKLELAQELGDVLWYLANVSKDIGYDLNDIAKMNLFKLRARKKKGTIKGEGDYR